MRRASAQTVILKDEVHFLLKRALSREEGLVREQLLSGKTHGTYDNRYRVDFYLRLGCKKLGFPKETVVEVKEKILYDTFDRNLLAFEKLRTIGIQAYVLVYKDAEKLGEVIDHLPEGFQALSIESLRVAVGIDKNGAYSTDSFFTREQRIKLAQLDAALGKSTFFLGSGVSIDAGLPNWSTLLKRILSRLNTQKPDLKFRYSVLDNDSQRSSIIMARYLENAFNDTDAFMDAVRDSLYQNAPGSSEIINTICRIIKFRNNQVGDSSNSFKSIIKWGQIDSVITYNYDDCLERQLKEEKVYYHPITKGNRVEPGAFPVYHVHGFIPLSRTSRPDDIVLTEESYHSIYQEAYHWSNIEQLHALANTTYFFIGLSMLDPNLRRLIDVAAARDTNDAFHYAILCRDSFEDFESADVMFRKLGVNVLWVNSFKEIPGVLSTVFARNSKIFERLED